MPAQTISIDEAKKDKLFYFVANVVVLEKDSFTDFAWVNSEEIKSYDCIKGVHEEVEQAIKLFS